MNEEIDPRRVSKKEVINFLGEGMMENFDPELKRAFDVADNEVPAELKDPKKLQIKEGCFKISGDGVFYSLQGEGPTMGRPTVFLRLQICNLACVWCDSWYTWNPKSKEFWTESSDWTVEQTAENVKKAWACEDDSIQKRLVITGGEPLLQKDRIDDLIDLLPEYKIEIETNGTIMPTEKLLKSVQFNCSPKLINSGNQRAMRIRKPVIEALRGADTGFKFVVMANNDLDEIEEDYIKGCGIEPSKVILMPQGVTGEEVIKNAQNVAEYAKQKGYRLLSRLHVELWGARRRV